MSGVIANILLVVALLPSMLWAQFDTTLGSTITQAHWECDGQTSLLEAAADPAEDGDGVQICTDTGSGGTNATQSTVGARPIVDIDGINDHPAMQGASGDFLNIADYDIARNLSGYTLAMVLKYVDNASVQGWFQLPNAAGGNRITIYKDSGDNIYIIQTAPDGTDKSVYTNDQLTDGNVHVVVVVTDFANNSTKLYVDSTEVHSATLSGGVNTSNTAAIEPVGVMASNPYGGSTSISLHGHFIWYKYALSGAKAVELSDDLADYWATPAAATATPLRMMMGVGQ